MLVDVGAFCQNLELHFVRADFEVTDKRVDDIAFFPLAAEQKVDRFNLNDLYIPAVFGVYNAVCDLLNREVLCCRVQIT